MNRKNLIDAFGDIDEEMFAGAENKSLSELAAESSEDEQAPVFVEVRKHRNGIRAALYAGAGIAACIALAAALPVLTDNTKLPYGNGSTIYSESSVPELSQTEPGEETEQTEITSAQTVTSAAQQEPPQLQLYTKTKEILNAEDIYNIEKTQIDISGFESSQALWHIHSNGFFGGTMLIDGSSFFYTVLGSPTDTQEITEPSEEAYAKISLFNMSTGEHSLILKERSYEGKYGLLFKPMNYVDGWLYYYRMEYMPAGDLEGYGTELWRINVDTKDKEKITDIYMDFYLSMKPGLQLGKYLYFTDCYSSYEENKSTVWILRYDTEAGKLDTFKEFVNEGGRPFAYKDGMIYCDSSGFWFHTDDGEPDKFLFDYDCYDIQAIGGNTLICTKESIEANYISATIEIMDENFEVRELALFPCFAYLKDVVGSLDLKLIGLSTTELIGSSTLIYDKEADCFSRFKLPTKDDDVVYCTADGDELKILVYSGTIDKCDGMTLYTIKR